MGGGTNRGNTYNWVVNHLADAYGETTPRAFLVALAQAAVYPTRASTVIDHLGIQAGNPGGIRAAFARTGGRLLVDTHGI